MLKRERDKVSKVAAKAAARTAFDAAYAAAYATTFSDRYAVGCAADAARDAYFQASTEAGEDVIAKAKPEPVTNLVPIPADVLFSFQRSLSTSATDPSS